MREAPSDASRADVELERPRSPTDVPEPLYRSKATADEPARAPRSPSEPARARRPESSKMSRTLFVRGFNERMRPADVANEFQRFGELVVRPLADHRRDSRAYSAAICRRPSLVAVRWPLSSSLVCVPLILRHAERAQTEDAREACREMDGRTLDGFRLVVQVRAQRPRSS